MIGEGVCKNLEVVYLENNNIKTIIIPKLGGKIFSLYDKKKDFELIYQNKISNFKEPDENSYYNECNICGFDDLFPTVDECIVSINGKEVKYPDYGEIWKKHMSYSIDEENLYMECESDILPYKYEKIISLYKRGINIQYKIENTGEYDFPCIWASNFQVNCTDDIDIDLPGDINEVINVKNSKILGRKYAIHPFPITMSEDGSILRLDKITLESKEYDEKYYALEAVDKGKASIYYGDSDIKYKLKYNKNVLPYIGLSINQENNNGKYLCSLILTNGFHDDINTAINNKKIYTLKKNEILEFEVSITLK